MIKKIKIIKQDNNLLCLVFYSFIHGLINNNNFDLFEFDGLRRAHI